MIRRKRVRRFRYRLRQWSRPFGLALTDSVDHDGVEHAGYLAFLFLLAFFPFIFFIIALTGTLGRTDIAARIAAYIIESDVLPDHALVFLAPRVEEILTGPPHELMTLAVLGAVWTASSLLEGMRTVFNRAHRVITPPAYILRRLMSIGQFLLFAGSAVLVVGLLILLPGVLMRVPFGTDILAIIHNLTSTADLPNNVQLFTGSLRFLFTAGILFTLVSILYMTITNMKVRDMYVMPGALACVALWFFLGKMLVLYLRDIGQVQLIYGSLGGIIAALFFFYLSAMALIYGAELNYHLKHRR